MHEHFSTIAAPLNADLRAALEPLVRPQSGSIAVPDYLRCVLYHPQLGYYRSKRPRVGRRQDADFYTAASLGGSLFAELLIEAIATLLPAPLDQYCFVEIGPEQPGGILASLPDPPPFAATTVIGPAETLAIPAHAVVFSNEVFDAQPFSRFCWNGEQWLEAAIRLTPEGLLWCLQAADDLPDNLPLDRQPGYLLDWPCGAIGLMRQIAGADWCGLLIACDYGYDRHTLTHERPAGTARTYHKHRAGRDLLSNPGCCDITCHIAWDVLEGVLQDAGFNDIKLARKESFLLEQARQTIARIVSDSAGGFSRRRQSLFELLHPQHMGSKFQVLTARR